MPEEKISQKQEFINYLIWTILISIGFIYFGKRLSSFSIQLIWFIFAFLLFGVFWYWVSFMNKLLKKKFQLNTFVSYLIAFLLSSTILLALNFLLSLIIS